MANQLGGETVAPRSYSRHQRHRQFARIRGGADQFSTFLTTQATRLSTTTSAIFVFLKKNTAQRIKNAANTGQLS